MNPTSRGDYVIDLTKEYRNMLSSTSYDCDLNASENIAANTIGSVPANTPADIPASAPINASTQTFTWADEELVESSTDVDMNIPQNRYTFLNDDLGSTMRMSNGAGVLQATYAYDEFGQEILDGINTLKNALGKVADLVNPFGFVGYQRDNIADDYFAEAREYRPEEGRFSGTDVIQGTIEMPFTLNRYGYCYNNGMLMNDLNGMWPNPIKWVKNKASKAVKVAKAVGNAVKSHKRQIIGGAIQVAASGFITGAGIEMGSQYSSGKDFNKMDYKEVAIQGGIGAAFSVLPGAASGLKCLSKINSHHIEAAVNGFIGAGASVITDVREGKSGGTISKDAFSSFAANATISYIGNPVKKTAENHTNVSVEMTEENIQTIEEQMPLLDGKEEYIAKLKRKLHKKGYVVTLKVITSR